MPRCEIYFTMKQQDVTNPLQRVRQRSDKRARSPLNQTTPFHWSILLLTSLIWITQPDWCLTRFKPLRSNWM